ncbi:MAG: alpha/beta fold hydrolase [Alphaproteobacteria bacterium]|nr:alpha/beta fold hydrolase [Alphaproteobacteria bacterium]MCB9794351.1 alpha/beta fold hydrolase [Alphaproteobacteria bacterium]
MSRRLLSSCAPLLLLGCAAGPLSPGGPQAVGTTTWVVEHPATLVDPLPPEEGPRRVPVQAWYPTGDAEPGELLEDAALLDPSAPVLVFVHGGGSERAMHASLFEDLASHGYVAIAADHPGVSRAARYPDQRTVKAHEDYVATMDSGDTLIAAAQPLFPELVDLMRADVALALDALPPGLDGLDTERLAVGGHSLGASVALDLCRDDARCVLYVNLDGPPLIDQVGVDAQGRAVLEAQSLDLPTVIVSTGLYAEHVPGAAQAWAALDAQAERVEGPVLHWHIAEAGHLDVTDLPLMMPQGLARRLFGEASIGHIDPVETLAAANDAMRLSLDRWLACDADATPEAVDALHPELVLRHEHEDRRGEAPRGACP